MVLNKTRTTVNNAILLETGFTGYRSISLPSCLGKTLEHMNIKRLMWHLKANTLITKQTTFRRNRSTKDQLKCLAQPIENAFQDEKKIIVTFIDLSKAFNKVWKEGLLLKLSTGNAFQDKKTIATFIDLRCGKKAFS